MNLQKNRKNRRWLTLVILFSVLSFCVMLGEESSAVNLEPLKDKPVTRKEFLALAGKVAELQKQLATNADATLVTDSMEELEARVVVLETVLDARTAEFTNEINVLMSKVAALETQLAAKADTTSVADSTAALEAKVAALEAVKCDVTKEKTSTLTPEPNPSSSDYYGDDKKEEPSPPSAPTPPAPPPAPDYYGPQ